MGKTYAIGDLHGRNDVLEACLAAIEKHRIAAGDSSGSNTTIVFLGDYIDRGKESRQVVARLMEGSRDSARWITLMGNHEEMAVMAHADPNSYWKWWTENGGLTTSLNYPGRRIDDEHLEWMKSLPMKYQDRYRLFVHAGVKAGETLSEQSDRTLLWIRHHRDEEVPFPLYVVHGHTPWRDGPVVLESRCNLDINAYATGTAVVAVFDDDKAGKPVEMLTVRAGYTPTW